MADSALQGESGVILRTQSYLELLLLDKEALLLPLPVPQQQPSAYRHGGTWSRPLPSAAEWGFEVDACCGSGASAPGEGQASHLDLL